MGKVDINKWEKFMGKVYVVLENQLYHSLQKLYDSIGREIFVDRISINKFLSL